MALSELETNSVEKLVSNYIEKNRPPAHLRSKIDLGYKIADQSWCYSKSDRAWTTPDQARGTHG